MLNNRWANLAPILFLGLGMIDMSPVCAASGPEPVTTADLMVACFADEATPQRQFCLGYLVISYPLERMYIDKGLSENAVAYMVMDHARSFIAEVAAVAFTLGLLVRGGITVGKLYHHEGVVFGQGLVDAYRLESEVAVYPRAVLSSAMAASPAWRIEDRLMVKRDFDGVYHLDYLHPLIMSFAPGGINWVAGLAKRMEIVQDEIQKTMADLESNGLLREAAKWGWFGNKLSESMKLWPNTASAITD